MKVYKVSLSADDSVGGHHHYWFRTKLEAQKFVNSHNRQLKEDWNPVALICPDVKLEDTYVKFDAYDVPRNKKEFIAWLNNNINGFGII